MAVNVNKAVNEIFGTAFFAFAGLYAASKASSMAWVSWGICYWLAHGTFDAEINSLAAFSRLGDVMNLKDADFVGELVTLVANFVGYLVGAALALAFEVSGCGPLSSAEDDGQAFGAELILSFLLLWWTRADNSTNQKGFAYALVMLCGAVCNPWLALAPQLVMDGCKVPSDVWVQIVGPIAACVVGPFLHNYLFTIGGKAAAKDDSV